MSAISIRLNGSKLTYRHQGQGKQMRKSCRWLNAFVNEGSSPDRVRPVLDATSGRFAGMPQDGVWQGEIRFSRAAGILGRSRHRRHVGQTTDRVSQASHEHVRRNRF